MQLHLVVPGLLWPSRALHDTVFDLELPALSRLFSRGAMTWRAPQALETMLCREFGITEAELPFAPLRLMGESGLPNPGSDVWLCADLAHLAIEQQRLILAGDNLAVDADHMRAIAPVASTLFSERMPGSEFFAASEGRGYLRLPRLPQIVTTPPSAVAGHTVESDLPRGPEAREWLRLGNEFSMGLTSLAVNDQRETLGLGSVNTMWFWGAGTLPARRLVPYDALFADDALGRGLANWAGISCLQVPSGSDSLPSCDRALVIIDDLQKSAQELDATAWRAALSALERDWLAPICTKLGRGGIDKLRISALGAEGILDVVATSSHRLKFWRPLKPLHRLLAPAP